VRVLTASETDRPQAARAFADPSQLVVVSLCAAWCDTCDVFRAAYERLASVRSSIAFVWLDIEDDAALCGDVDIENFPTLAIYRGREPVHFGVSLPTEAVVGRMIDALAASARPLDAPSDAVAALPAAFESPT
jgi:thioredoxin reductase (NADPH)